MTTLLFFNDHLVHIKCDLIKRFSRCTARLAALKSSDKPAGACTCLSGSRQLQNIMCCACVVPPFLRLSKGMNEYVQSSFGFFASAERERARNDRVHISAGFYMCLVTDCWRFSGPVFQTNMFVVFVSRACALDAGISIQNTCMPV